MIAIVPVRFTTNTDPASVWSEDVFRRWMQPLIPYSLGDFWWSCSHALFSVECRVYNPIVIADPRIGVAPGNGPQRSALVNGGIAAATSQLSPDWDGTDILMLWFAQPTDMFGGGKYNVPLRSGGKKLVPVTVVDIASAFDATCQELGHSFGLDHELDEAGQEYGSPYSVMSARAVDEFVRPGDARLPDGHRIIDPRDPMIGNLAQRVVGPALAAAQLYRYPEFRNTASAIHLPGSYKQTPATVTLYALNYTTRQPAGPLPVLASLESNAGESRVFTVEFRRGGIGYDKAIGTNGHPAGLVVHSINPDGRVRYEGVVSLESIATRADWRSPAGNFSLRLLEVDPGGEFVKFLAGAELPAETAPAASGPAVAWGPNRLDLFGVDADKALNHLAWGGSVWSAWEKRGGKLAQPVDAVCWGPNRIDLFGVGSDTATYHMAWDGSRWSDWEAHGGAFIQPPKAVSWAPNRIDVFGVDKDRGLRHMAWDGSRWSGWEKRGGILVHPVDAVCWGPNRIDVFGIGTDNSMFHLAWDGSKWSDWEARGGFLVSPPKAVSWGPNRIDVFGMGKDRGLYHMAWDGSRWSGWEQRGGVLVHPVDAVSWGPNRIDVFGIGTDHALFHMKWDGSGWSAWERLGGALAGSPKAVCWATNRIDVFGIGDDRALHHIAWNGLAWSDWESRGGDLVSF